MQSGGSRAARLPLDFNFTNNYAAADMNEDPSKAGNKGVVVYACSGCSDAGELADRTARALSQTGLAEMSCLAGIGGRVRPLLRTAEEAAHIVAIDGCPLNCARHTLEQAGFNTVHHLELQNLGFRKGDCPPTEQRLAAAVKAGKELLQNLGMTKQEQI